jgi:hypothetical protein
MAKATGYAALSALTAFTAKKWFTKSFVTLVGDISRLYGKRNEVAHGLKLAYGSGTLGTGTAQLNYSAGAVTLDGSITDLAAATNTDFLAFDASKFVMGAIFSNGTASKSGAALALTSSNEVNISVILINSTGAGGVQADAEFLCVISGAGPDGVASGSAALTTAEINVALAASAGNDANHDHSGGASANCNWIHVASFVLDNNGGSQTAVVTENRNNVLTR